ncbi:uncharacterized protein EI90DRAFT_2599467 [Cantharellus anzutake]|uniref:uncharacterized protein n=1 Tax=Cantharellus anzutake TaxID=1750568 RepID=UPI001907ABBE|nr:uncharacterized protein EI90DRAFT_2599467 [Cantharellus anzutake]KAF8320537.1 hypothetical protein EI90DRAFT_2599467 [Cantharellus anzutake]
MTNPHPNPTSKGTSEDSGVQSDNVRGAPPSPLGSSPFCRLPKQTYRSRIDISQEPELPASYKQRMMNIQRDSATTTTATSKDGERQPVRYSANTLSSSRDRDTNADSNEQHDASDSKKERSPYDYPPMTPATIPDSHRRDYDEDVPEMPPLPASVVGSSYLRRVPSLPLLNRTGTHSRRLEHAQTARVPTSEFASESELPPSYLQRFNELNKHDSRHPTRLLQADPTT